ncbi:MAG TPA: CpXC domain-containing protein [Polyangiaceae bacterium]|nr:CpXC domain-containing protein [Polyangiaceae bacterium]
MAVFRQHTVSCACGEVFKVALADSINVKRSPSARDAILRGELHRSRCPRCKQLMAIEKPFYYTDLSRNDLFKVLPRGERHTWTRASRQLDAAASLVPEGLSRGSRRLRVVFGLDELREKLVAEDAGFDDRVVELLKVLVVYEHPVLIRRPRLRLTLESIGKRQLQFQALYEHDPKGFRIMFPRLLADGLARDQAKLEAWTKSAHRAPLFELPDHWVNIWRWSPQPSALERLRGFSQDIESGRSVDTTSDAFTQMLRGLPHGSHLPSWAKQDLRKLELFAKSRELPQLEAALFRIRFDIELENDWAENDDPNDIDTLWRLLKDLPDTDVEGNTKIHELVLDEGHSGGLYSFGSHDISIGSDELANQEGFEDVVRHEVGHSVHEMHESLVDQWLAEKFGWQKFSTQDADIDAWVGLMGDWGPLTASQKGDVRQALRTALGPGGRWDPGPTPMLSATHPWHGASFGPRLAFEQTGSHWYQNFRSWYRANGKAFFLNYWYETLIVVDESTLELIARMPDNYAAMSHFEFFAELYALFYDTDDPQRGAIPPEVQTWLATTFGAAETGAPTP